MNGIDRLFDAIRVGFDVFNFQDSIRSSWSFFRTGSKLWAGLNLGAAIGCLASIGMLLLPGPKAKKSK